jgi:hypothetical protein
MINISKILLIEESIVERESKQRNDIWEGRGGSPSFTYPLGPPRKRRQRKHTREGRVVLLYVTP